MIEMLVGGFVLGLLIGASITLSIMNRYNKRALDLANDDLSKALVDYAERIKHEIA